MSTSHSVTALDGRELRIAQKAFTVERQLNVTVKPKQEVYGPGSEAEVEIQVTDQLGKPVESERSLALVDEALFSLFRDVTPPILDFFQKDARCHAAFRASSSAGFAYFASTRKVIKKFLDERARLYRRKEEDKRIELATRQLRDRQMAPTGSEILQEMASSGSGQQGAQQMGLDGNLPISGFLSNGRTSQHSRGTQLQHWAGAMLATRQRSHGCDQRVESKFFLQKTGN